MTSEASVKRLLSEVVELGHVGVLVRDVLLVQKLLKLHFQRFWILLHISNASSLDACKMKDSMQHACMSFAYARCYVQFGCRKTHQPETVSYPI